jgi:hypothetical protein
LSTGRIRITGSPYGIVIAAPAISHQHACRNSSGKRQRTQQSDLTTRDSSRFSVSIHDKLHSFDRGDASSIDPPETGAFDLKRVLPLSATTVGYHRGPCKTNVSPLFR